MVKLIAHVLFWLIALAIIAVIVLLLSLYLYPHADALRDKPIATLTLRDVGHIFAFGFVAVGGSAMLFRLIGGMAETFRDDLDDWRNLKRRIKCPRCQKMAWNDTEGAHCPHCGWDANYERDFPELFRDDWRSTDG